MNLIHAILLGIVEGASEFLPVSSTGHLILASHLMGLHQTEFLKSFDIVIQLGAILAVLVLYAKSLVLNLNILKKVAAAFIPTAILGFVLYKVIKNFLLGNPQVVIWALFLGGIFLIFFERWHRRERETVQTIEAISYPKAFLIGFAQALAVIPGVSRSAATILGGLLLGIGRKTIVEFSFLLAIPTMAAASALDLIKSAGNFSFDQFGLLIAGFISSFMVAIICIKWLLGYIQKHTFVAFGIYRIAAAVLFWLFVRPL